MRDPESQPISEWQKLVAKNYGDGDYAYMHDWPQSIIREACTEVGYTGDSLFNFLMLELSPLEDCDGWQEALSRINSAVEQLQEMQALIEKEANARPD